MAAITANLLAAVAPPVSPPPPPASESVPKSGFAQALSGASSQSQPTNTTNRPTANTTTSDTSTAATNNPEPTTDTTNPDDQKHEDTTAQSAAAAVLAAFGLIPQQTLPTVVTTEATATTTTAAATAVPQATTTTPATVPTNTDESRSQALQFLTTSAQSPAATTTNTTPATQTPATQQQPTTTPTTVATTTPTVPNTPAIPTTTADTTTAVLPAATNTPSVVPQAPVVVDPRQQAPVAPPEIGYGLIGPTPTAVPQVKEVPPVGAGPSQAQVELRAAVLPRMEAAPTITPEAVAATTAAVPFSQVLTDSATKLTEPATADATTTAASAQAGQNMPAVNTPTTAPRPAATNSPPVVSQLHDAFVTHAQVVPKDGGHEFQLRLDPPELGEVKVRVLAMGDRVEARLVVSDDAVKRMIESQLPELRQRLEAAGVPVQKFDVMTGDGGRSNTGGGGWDRSQPAPTPRNTAATTSLPAARPTQPGGLIDVTA